MRRGLLLVAGLGLVVGLASIALSEQAPPGGENPGGYVSSESGECVSFENAAYVVGAPGASTPEGALEAIPQYKGIVTEMTKRTVNDKHVVFEKQEDDKVTAAYDVVDLGNGWVLQQAQQLGGPLCSK